MLRWLTLLPFALPFALLSAACAAPSELPEVDAQEGCAYPAATSFALGATLPPFAWVDARLPSGELFRFDLAAAHYEQPGLDPFEFIVFAAIPSW